MNQDRQFGRPCRDVGTATIPDTIEQSPGIKSNQLQPSLTMIYHFSRDRIADELKR
jgi:hypothetical protein